MTRNLRIGMSFAATVAALGIASMVLERKVVHASGVHGAPV